jgi:hypothetical protein
MGGPRYDAAMTERVRRSQSNAIWLCGGCARLIDGDCARYPVSVLRFWRQDAEDRAQRELGRSTPLLEAARLASIVLDPRCMWANSHRLGKIAEHLKGRPEIGFHAIPEQAWSDYQMSALTHSVDPILDVTLVNDTASTAILSQIGFEAHSVWSDLKGLPHAYKVELLDGYVLNVSPIVPGDMQLLQLADPIALPAGAPARIQLTLAGFRANLPGNESLLRIIAIADGIVHRSRLFEFGVY